MPGSNWSSRNTRALLLAGFGGLLLLMALAALDALRILQSIERRSNVIREDFLERNRLLNQIRSDLYLSGTWVRDYVLEPDPANADAQKANLKRIRTDLEQAIDRYAKLPGNDGSLEILQRELQGYWKVIDPVMHSGDEARKAAGYAFLRDEVYPRRTAMVALADEIGAFNEHQWNARILQVTALFSGFKARVGITMLITLGLGGLLAAFSTSRILNYQREVAGNLREIEQARSELKELSTRLLEVQENERRALSRELHDEVGQSLSALLVTIGNLKAELPEEYRASQSGRLAELRALAESSLRSVRNMTLLLRPSMLDDLGLIPALQWQGREVSRRTPMNVSIDAAGVPEDLPDEYRTSIYRLVQEAIHNSEKHAHASSVRVTMRAHSNSLVLSVQDDGRGFDIEREKGMGLLGMHERVENLGGTFNVESEIGRGTLIMVRLPLPA
ncbi:MAG TPA: ATP-binding protein [Bryobacteraceae bacterium]|nr:ATP-binding protein [Bryobacteraceae bacterium]